MNNILLFVLLCTGITMMRADWNPATTRTTQTLRSIAFTSADTAFAVGDSGTIIRTVNGGDDWNVIPSLTTQHLASVAVRGRQAIAVGMNGTVTRTRSGVLWIASTVVTGVHFADVVWTSDATAIAVGYTAAADSGVVMMTADSGRTWVRAYAPAPNDAHVLTSIAMAPDGLHGVIGGHAVSVAGSGAAFVYVTTNGGYRWDRVDVTSAPFDVRDVTMPSSATILMSGSAADGRGGMWRSDDAGATWRFMPERLMTDVRSLHMLDARRGVAVGLAVDNGGGAPRSRPVVFTTTDGGERWSSSWMGTVQNVPVAISAGYDAIAVAVGVEGSAHVGSIGPWSVDVVRPARRVIEFGARTAYTEYDTTVTVLRNTHSAPVTVTGCSIVGDQWPFALPDAWTGPVRLAPGDSLRVRFRFAPREEGSFESVAILHMADGRDMPILLSGSGDAITRDDEPIVFDVPYVDFGSFPMTATRDTLLEAVIRNTGNTSRVLRSITLDGVDIAGYGLRSVPPENIELAPGATLSVHILCHPTHIGPMLAQLVLDTDVGRRRLPLVSMRSEDAWEPLVDIDSVVAGSTVTVEQTFRHVYDLPHTVGSIDIPDATVLVIGTTPPMPAYVSKDSAVAIRMNLYPHTEGTWLIPMRVQWHVASNVTTTSMRRVVRTYVKDGATSVPSLEHEQAVVVPQPATQRVTIRHSEIMEGAVWTLYDLRGHEVRSGRAAVSGEANVDLIGLAPGVYRFSAVSSERSTTAIVRVQ